MSQHPPVATHERGLKKVIVITGPTAVGKTAVALSLAEQLNTSIISADSRQCFKELNIGVAKPTPAELQAVRHYFINSHSLHEMVDAAVFERYALHAADAIFTEHDVAVMVGGTGMYIKAFCEGLDKIPEPDPEVRSEIRKAYETHGLEWLQRTVEQEDPEYYGSGETMNPQRLMRALEVIRSSGRSIRAHQGKQKEQRPFQIIKIGLAMPREALNARIHHRVDLMMEQGLLKEVQGLVPHKALNALQTVGYKEIFEHIEGKCSLEAAVEFIKTNTRQYAKRQMTWFRKDEAIRWFAPDDLSGIMAYLRPLIH